MILGVVGIISKLSKVGDIYGIEPRSYYFSDECEKHVAQSMLHIGVLESVLPQGFMSFMCSLEIKRLFHESYKRFKESAKVANRQADKAIIEMDQKALRKMVESNKRLRIFEEAIKACDFYFQGIISLVDYKDKLIELLKLNGLYERVRCWLGVSDRPLYQLVHDEITYEQLVLITLGIMNSIKYIEE